MLVAVWLLGSSKYIGRDYSRLCLHLRAQAERVDSSLSIIVCGAHNENRLTPIVDVCDGNPSVWRGVHLRNTFLTQETESPCFTTHVHLHTFVLHIKASFDWRFLATRIDLPFPGSPYRWMWLHLRRRGERSVTWESIFSWSSFSCLIWWQGAVSALPYLTTFIN